MEAFLTLSDKLINDTPINMEDLSTILKFKERIKEVFESLDKMEEKPDSNTLVDTLVKHLVKKEENIVDMDDDEDENTDFYVVENGITVKLENPNEYDYSDGFLIKDEDLDDTYEDELDRVLRFAKEKKRKQREKSFQRAVEKEVKKRLRKQVRMGKDPYDLAEEEPEPSCSNIYPSKKKCKLVETSESESDEPVYLSFSITKKKVQSTDQVIDLSFDDPILIL